MVFDMGSIFLYLTGLFLLYLCCWLFLKPLKWLFRLFLSCAAGAAALAVFNFAAGFAGWHLALNPLTAMVTGVLGAPGMVLMLFLNSFL